MNSRQANKIVDFISRNTFTPSESRRVKYSDRQIDIAIEQVVNLTRRHLRNLSKKARDEGKVMLANYYMHKACDPYLVDDILDSSE